MPKVWIVSESTVVVNPEDVVTNMYSGVYAVRLSSGAYYAAADSEQDALDEVVDWMEKHQPEKLAALTIDLTTPPPGHEYRLVDTVFAGNKGHALRSEEFYSVSRTVRSRVKDLLLKAVNFESTDPDDEVLIKALVEHFTSNINTMQLNLRRLVEGE